MKEPILSVVMVAHRFCRSLQLAFRALEDQTIAETIEFIVMAPSIDELKAMDFDSDRLFSSRVIETGPGGSFGSAKAEGARAASAPLVAFMEDHSFPDSRWAEAMVEAHEQGLYAAAGPVMANANSRSPVSWACFLVFYGAWSYQLHENETTHLPANHSSYPAALLLEYGDRLPDMMETESVLHWDMISRGHRLCHTGKAVVRHLGYTHLLPLLRETYLASWVFGADRSTGWSLMRKIGYILGTPLVPLVRLFRIGRCAARARISPWNILMALFATLITLAVSAAGEVSGYLLGYNNARQRLTALVILHSVDATAEDLVEIEQMSYHVGFPIRARCRGAGKEHGR